MKQRKIIAFFLSALMLISTAFSGHPVLAAGDDEFPVGLEVSIIETGEVAVSFVAYENLDSFGGMQAQKNGLTYDKDAFSYQRSEGISGCGVMFIEGTGGISVGPGTPNLIPAGTTLFTLYFTMTSQYEKGQNYQFALKCEAWDFDEDDYSWSNQSFTAVVHEHAYGEPEWEWTADYSSATASFACVGGDDTQIVTDDEIAMAEVTQATCTGNKVVKYTAEVTFEGETYSDTKDNVEVANTALGHNWGEWTVTTPATCTTAGEKTRECSRCHETETEPVAALGHNMTAYAAVEAKCEEDGNSAYWYCDRCQKYFSDENGENEIKEGSWVIEALGHNWGEWTVTTPATCTTAGEKTRECGRCHKTETEPVAALGHNMTAYAAVEAKCEEDGNSAYWYCERCQKYFSDENGENEIKEGSWVIEALGHNWGEWTVTTPATCTTAGEKTRECGRCHKTETEPVAALGHNMTAYAAVEAKCEEDGNSAYWYCERCQKYFSDENGENEIIEGSWVIEALGHDWGTPTYVWNKANEPWTCTATRVCSRDQSHTETETATAELVVITPATTMEEGSGEWQAAFNNEAFKAQAEPVTIPKIPGWHINLTNKTTTATTSLDAEMLYANGEVTFTVTNMMVVDQFDDPVDVGCIVVIDNGDGTYTELEHTLNGEEHQFTVVMNGADINLILGVRGDANLDGKLDGKDMTRVQKDYLMTKPLDALNRIFADANGDGIVDGKDMTRVQNFYLGNVNNIPWNKKQN